MTNAVEKLLEGVEGLTPEFKEKASVIFAAAVQEAVDAEIATKTTLLTESHEASLNEAIESTTATMLATLDDYLTEAVADWVKENAPALDSKLKSEVAVSLVEHFSEFMTKNGAILNESTDNSAVTILETQIAELTTKLDEATAALNEVSQKEAESARKLVFEAAVAELADSQKDRVTRILESMSFKDSEDYSKKLGFVVEAVAGPKDAPAEDGKKDDAPAAGKDGKDDEKKDGKDITESTQPNVVDTIVNEKTIDPSVAATLAYMRKSKSRK